MRSPLAVLEIAGVLTAPLVAHPALPPSMGVSASVEVHRTRDALRGHIHLVGDVDRVRWSEAGPAVRADGLWEHTVIEAFVGPPGSAAYAEFNVAPNGAWAAYAFAAAHERRRDLPATWRPSISSDAGRSARCVDVRFPLPRAACGALDVSIAMILEDDLGALSYWALSHPGDRPDFHDRRGFSLRSAGAHG